MLLSHRYSCTVGGRVSVNCGLIVPNPAAVTATCWWCPVAPGSRCGSVCPGRRPTGMKNMAPWLVASMRRGLVCRLPRPESTVHAGEKEKDGENQILGRLQYDITVVCSQLESPDYLRQCLRYSSGYDQLQTNTVRLSHSCAVLYPPSFLSY